VHPYIRTLAETACLKERLLSARHVTVEGTGFIGLEFASAGRRKGLIVDVIELGQRLMERAVTPEISQFFLRRHERSGVNFHFGTEVAGIERGGGDGRYTIALAQGKKIETDLVVAGIGVNPNTELAASAGLVVNGGILVDQNLSTSDANISAIGDCVVFPTPTRPSPSESSLFRMQRIRPAVSPRAVSGKVHLIGACRGFGAIKEAICYR
jgi:3-phenylpropionate/trans-cinnamate dioxygenase ferredoxin reductase component